MSQTHDEQPRPDEDDTQTPALDETPPVAGGNDDGEPEQGEGAQDSY